MRFNKNIGIGADPVANKRIYLEMLASDVFGIDIDQIVNPFTGVGINKGIDVQREIRTPSGDFSLSNFVYDSHIDNYAGLKDTTVSRSISTDGVVCHAASYGDFEGTLGALAYMLVYGLDGFAADEGKDLSSGNARRYTYGANIAARNMVEVNKPSGAIELRTYGVNIDYAYLLPTLIAGTLTAKAFGLYANVLGNLAGDSVAYGVYTKVSGADKNYGYYSEDPSLRSAPITAVPTDIPDEGTFRIYGPAGGPYRIYSYLDGAWRLVASHPHASRHVAGGDDDLFSTDLIPTTDGLFLGSDTKRWDGSKLINQKMQFGHAGGSPTYIYWTVAGYFTWLNSYALSSVEAARQSRIMAGTFKKLRVYVRANGLNQDVKIALRVNGSDSALVVTIPAGTTGNFTSTADVAVADDDLVGLRLYADTAPTSGAADIGWSIDSWAS